MSTVDMHQERVARCVAAINQTLSGVPELRGHFRERVAQGVALLDEVMPDWAERIDLARLDLGSPCNCILGQTWDEPYDPADEDAPYFERVRWLFGGLVYMREEIACGFNAHDEAEFPALTAEWRRVIEGRRSTS